MKRTRDITNAQKRISERTLGKRDCTWYGEAYCHGDEVIVSTCKNKSGLIRAIARDLERPFLQSVVKFDSSSIFRFIKNPNG